MRHSPRASLGSIYLPWALARVRQVMIASSQHADPVEVLSSKGCAAGGSASVLAPALFPGAGVPAAGSSLAGGAWPGQTSPG